MIEGTKKGLIILDNSSRLADDVKRKKRETDHRERQRERRSSELREKRIETRKSSGHQCKKTGKNNTNSREKYGKL